MVEKGDGAGSGAAAGEATEVVSTSEVGEAEGAPWLDPDLHPPTPAKAMMQRSKERIPTPQFLV